MNNQYKPLEVGSLRPSQLMHTFGVGAIVDLPELSVIVLGIDAWNPINGQDIGEERLLRAVQYTLGPQVKHLYHPPIATDDNDLYHGIPVAPFPRWMVCPSCRMLSSIDDGVFDLKINPAHPERTRYVHTQCKTKGPPPTVLPVRFLVACERGHLDDFPWSFFVHRGEPCPNGGGTLRLRELGISGEATDIRVECEGCGAKRFLADAFGQESKKHMPLCRGRYPHLRDFDDAPCSFQMRTILLGASNSWFGVSLSVLSIPSSTDKLAQLVAEHWHILEAATVKEIVPAFRMIGKLNRFSQYSDDEIWAAIETKRTTEDSEEAKPQSLKAPEWHMFTHPTEAPATKDFEIQAVPVPTRYAKELERVVLAHRLREVRALLGFTRLISPGNFAEPTDVPKDTRAPMTRQEPTWVPATAVHGEGIFLQFRETTLQAWLNKPAVKAYEEAFYQAHIAWRNTRNIPDPTKYFPGLRYVLLHTLAHALMRQMALACGYTATSIRERIYALPPDDPKGPMAGILLYTAAPDSEGTLGGLVRLGDQLELEHHLTQALEHLQFCASDPLCAEHMPEDEPQQLHGAACHACTFVAETSCERSNRYLDRSLLVETVDQKRRELALFGDGLFV